MYIDFSMVQEYLHQYGPGPLAEWRRQVAQHDMSNARYKQVFRLNIYIGYSFIISKLFSLEVQCDLARKPIHKVLLNTALYKSHFQELLQQDNY